jgi:hypothetical protein
MSVLPLKADIRQREWHVRYVPEADIAIEPRRVRASRQAKLGVLDPTFAASADIP